MTKDKFDIPQEGDNITIEVKSNIEYQVSIPSQFQSWIKEAVKSKAVTTKSFNFTISANERFDKREGYIVFSGNSLKDTVYVYQAANAKTLILTKDNYSITSEGKTIEVELKSNINYDIIIPDSVSSWIKRIQTKAIRTDKINLKIESNTKYDYRQAIVIFKDKDSSLADTLKINQVQKNAIILTQKQYQAKATGEDLTVELNSNIEYDVIISQDAISWISQIKTKALTTDILKFHIEANPESNKRSTKILFKAKNSNYSDTLQITQLADRAISLAKEEYSLSSTVTNIVVEVTTNIDFKTIIPTNAQSWIKLIQTVSTQKNSLSFSISANDNYEKRSAKIKIVDMTDDGNFVEFTINQTPKDTIIIEQKLYEVSAKGETIEVTIKKNTDYTIKIPDACKEWIQQVLTRSLSTEHLSFNILSNTLLNKREGNIIIEYNSYSDTIKIVQKAKSDTFYGDVFFHHIEGLEQFKEDGYKKVKGNVTVEGNILTSLEKSDNILEEIDGDLIIQCSSLRNLDGLYSLKRILGNLIIKNVAMTSFEGLNNLEEIGKDFEISANNSLNALISFQGLGKLSSIGQNFKISASAESLNALSSFEGLENLTTVGGDFEISAVATPKAYISISTQNNLAAAYALNALTSFKGLNRLSNIGGLFKIYAKASNEIKVGGYYYTTNPSYALNKLASFEGLENLPTINGNFEINAETSCSSVALNALTSFQGLSKLNSIGGYFKIIANASFTSYSLESLTTFGGLENLTTINSDFEINANASLNALTSFKGLSRLSNIGRNFEITASSNSSLASLASFEGLENLTTINGNFEISASSLSSLNALTSFQGLSKLNSIGGHFSVPAAKYFSQDGGLTCLKSCKGDLRLFLKSDWNLTSLQYVNGGLSLYGTENQLLLPALNMIGNNLNIVSCTSINVHSLKTIGGYLTINSSCKHIDISSLNIVRTGITISDCSSLYDFCNFKSILTNYQGTFLVERCGYNPTKYQILNGECSK